ncbi:MAG: IS1595 family transposase [Mariprofundaceae bacterium]
MAKTFTVQDFFKRFPDDESCLNHLMLTRFGESLDCPKCGKHGKFSKIRKIPAYQCSWCAHQIHPMVGTPFAKSRTSLQKWFYAMYLFTTSRNGVAAKELQRQLGVTYKCAWRMANEIRKYMGEVDGKPPLTGHVEIDETYIGGKRRKEAGFTGRGAKGKTVVMGILERGGEIFTKVVPNASRKSLLPHILENVPTSTRISTDEWQSYKVLPKLGYDHNTVEHSAKEYARGDVHVNSLEGFWAILKRSIYGTHVHVSQKHMPAYLAEFEYRFNMRHYPEHMFQRLLASF